jgi:hypothetical protein
MSFRKNWTQFIVSKGEPFKIEFQPRAFGGRKHTVFEVTEEGVVQVNGVEMTGDQNITGNVVATGSVTAGNDLVATDDLTVGDDAAVGGDLTVTGLMKINATSFQSAVVTAEDASGGTQNQALVGAKVGDVVLAVINLTDGTDANSSYENTISVVDQIQQTGTDLTGKKIFVLIGHRS